MDMSSIIFVIVILCMLVAIVTLVFKPYDYGVSVKRFKGMGTSTARKGRLEDTKWRSVKIRPGLISCDRVAETAGIVFLSQEAPTLPLENCTETECRCHYIFLDDRRSGTDRRIELGKLDQFFPTYEGERRQVEGRRFADLAT